MFSLIRRWRHNHILAKHRIADSVWRSVLPQVRSTRHLSADDINRLHELASLFLYKKSIESGSGFVITEAIKARIACEAAVPVLNLGLEYYHAIYSVIVYEDAFYSRDVYQDEAGVLHTDPGSRAGEAWDRGPVIVSWTDIEQSRRGHNVIIHEMAHKLDMLDGVANGRPPLHNNMNPQAWTAAFGDAYARHTAEVEAGIGTEIDAYAATDPAEFFAVASEAFFEEPAVLRRVWPLVYTQLALYYRQETG